MKNKIKTIDKIGYCFCALYYLILFAFFAWIAYIAILSIPDIIFYINLWK